MSNADDDRQIEATITSAIRLALIVLLSIPNQICLNALSPHSTPHDSLFHRPVSMVSDEHTDVDENAIQEDVERFQHFYQTAFAARKVHSEHAIRLKEKREKAYASLGVGATIFQTWRSEHQLSLGLQAESPTPVPASLIAGADGTCDHSAIDLDAEQKPASAVTLGYRDGCSRSTPSLLKYEVSAQIMPTPASVRGALGGGGGGDEDGAEFGTREEEEARPARAPAAWEPAGTSFRDTLTDG